MNNLKSKIIVVLGPTASGKSDLAVDLALQFDGEIISADSRQVYKGLDIGSGKITKKEMKGIPHYLLDEVQPQRVFTAVQFKKKAEKIIKGILQRGKLPILAGGTGFYISAIVDNLDFPQVKENKELRKKLERLSVEELFEKLKKLDLVRAKNIDAKNPRRLVRAIEIATQLGQVPQLGNRVSKWEVLQIGIKTDKEILKERIAKRFYKRVRAGIVAEAKKLHQKGLSYKRMNELGLAHKYIALYLQKKISQEEFIEQSIKEEQKYVKRQITWFKRDKNIQWFDLKEKNKILSTIKAFLKTNA
ncbi:MAG: tRNA (adenosine(37)-N6)-dimethylallyltransferase MiaA [Patescibacteria group bacterium]